MMKKKAIAIVCVIAMGLSAIPMLAYVPTNEEVMQYDRDNPDDDGVVLPFGFATTFDSSVKPIEASSIDIPIFKNGIAIQIKWAGVKNAKKYKFTVKNLKTDKVVYSLITTKTTASFPASKNKQDGSYSVTIQALSSKGKTMRTYKTVFHTGKVIVDTDMKINPSLVLYAIHDYASDLIGITYHGMFGEIQEDGTLRLTGEKVADM